MVTKLSAPIFCNIESIYPGPHIDANGNIDERVWFQIPIDLDVDSNYITYMVFPYGAKDSEIQELTIEASGSWLG